MAQIAYRLEKYNESYDSYRDLIKNIDDDYDAERQTNLSAVVAALKQKDESSAKELDMSENEKRTYELCYNSACIALSKGQVNEAYEKLRKAEQMCIETLSEEQEGETDQEFVDQEIAIIKVQLAYCLQRMGRTDEALKLYNAVSKTKPSDVTVMAALNNNMVCLNRDQNIFDSKKRIKSATGPELELKLNSYQLRTIAYNEILFSILTNQKEAANKLLEQYKKKFADLEGFVLLKCAQLHKEKKFLEAESFLRETLNNLPSNSSTTNLLKFYFIQILLLQQNKIKEAIETLKSVDEYKQYKLGIISSLVTLLKSKQDKEGISDLFSRAIDYYSKFDANSKELEVYIRENSNYQISCNNFQKACEMLEKMHSLYPKDTKILSKLINTYSKFDPEKAKKFSKELPSLEDVLANSSLDIDTLEQQFSLLNSKYGKTKVADGPKSPTKSNVAGDEIKKKKKKKKKIMLPKNYNPNIAIDQERWLPLRERSYYKGKRKKKNAVGKGTQGAVSSVKETTPGTPQPQSPRAPVAAESEKPKPKAPIQQKKKKKGGAKW